MADSLNELQNKLCKSCGLLKPLTEFNRQSNSLDGHYYQCKLCHRSAALAYHFKNRTERLQCMKTYERVNKKKIRDRRRKYERDRYHTDEHYRTMILVRKRIQKIFGKKSRCSKHTEELIGCDIDTLLLKIGPRPSSSHHLDHICPLAQARTEEEQEKLCHHSNLRWLDGIENASKKDLPTPEGILKCKELLGRDWVDCAKQKHVI